MKRLNLQYISVQILCTASILAGTSGCAQAGPDEMVTNNVTNDITESAEIQIKPRRSYISPAVRRDLLVRAAQDEMRHDASPRMRTFFTEPDESGHSFSIGTTRDGYLVNGRSLPAPSLLLRQLPVQYERGIAFGTEEVIMLLVDTARAMEKKYPDTIMHLGNMGLREGGDIPYSISHNAGRDADIAFYLKDTDGNFARPDNLYKIGCDLKSVEPGSEYTFDVEKNATLMEILLTHPKIHVQFVFLARHLRTALYREFVSRHASPEFLERYEQTVQCQAAHNDHFHIRIYCSDRDICAGCVDRSLIHPWHEDPVPKQARCIERHASVIASRRASPERKAAALQRLALMGGAPDHIRDILKNLKHENETVRIAAAMAAREAGNRAVNALVDRYSVEKSPAVKYEILKSLTSFYSKKTRGLFHHELSEASADLPPGAIELLCSYIVHYPWVSDAGPLLAAWHRTENDAPIREAFSVVSNTELCTGTHGECLAAAQAWFGANAEKTRREWLIDGFNAAGFAVTTLENADIPILLDAIDGSRGISVNAQLLLKQIGHFHQDSLGWSVDDARWHYTRYFKRRSKRYKIDLSDRDAHGRRLAAQDTAEGDNSVKKDSTCR